MSFQLCFSLALGSHVKENVPGRPWPYYLRDKVNRVATFVRHVFGLCGAFPLFTVFVSPEQSKYTSLNDDDESIPTVRAELPPRVTHRNWVGKPPSWHRRRRSFITIFEKKSVVRKKDCEITSYPLIVRKSSIDVTFHIPRRNVFSPLRSDDKMFLSRFKLLCEELCALFLSISRSSCWVCCFLIPCVLFCFCWCQAVVKYTTISNVFTQNTFISNIRSRF